MLINENNSYGELTRLEALSDAVFAVAISLLVLEIHVPVSRMNESIYTALKNEQDSFIAFGIGFFTLLVCWINHRYLIGLIGKYNSVLSLINGIKLLTITITPFSTSLLAKNLNTTWEGSAISLYCLNYVLLGASMTLVWLYSRYKNLNKGHSDIELKSITIYFLCVFLAPLFLFGLSFIEPKASLFSFSFMFLASCLPETIVKKTTQYLKRFY